jgi:ribonuclease HI
MTTIDYYVYTDGACSKNGSINAAAGIGIFFGINDPRNISRRIVGKQTNNIAELTAIIETFSILSDGKNIGIVTDSEYAIRCCTSYGEKCSKKAWKDDIPNKELVRAAYELYENKPKISLIHIKAHTDNTDIHSIGNAHADRLANQAIGVDIRLHPSRIFLKVPFVQKDEVKKLGGLWDASKKKWYIYEDNSNKDEILKQFPRE